MRLRYYKGMDRVIAKGRRVRQIREIKEGTLSVVKFLGCAVAFYGSVYIVWCSLCAMFPTWP